MKRNRLKNQNFIDYIPNIQFRDTKPYSPDYFQIFNIPDRIYLGKSSFRLNINLNNMVIGSRIFIELLDVNGNPIYYSISDKKMDDRSKIISIEIYDSTPNGIATLYIAGKCKKVNGTSIAVDDNLEIPNILYIHQILVVNSEITDDEIIFETDPSAKLELIQYPLAKTASRRESVVDNLASSGHVIQFESPGPVQTFKIFETPSGSERVLAIFKNQFKISFDNFIVEPAMVGGTISINNLHSRLISEYPKYNQYILYGNPHLIPNSIEGVVISYGIKFIIIGIDFELPINVSGFLIDSISDFEFELSYISEIEPTLSIDDYNYVQLNLKDLNLISGYCQDIEIGYKPYKTPDSYTYMGRHRILPDSVFNYFSAPNFVNEWKFESTPINTYITNPVSDHFTLSNLEYTNSDRIINQPKFKLINNLANGSISQINSLTYYPIIYKLECNLHSHSKLPFEVDFKIDSKQVTIYQSIIDTIESSTILGRVHLNDSNFQKVVIYFKPNVEITSKISIDISATSDNAPLTIEDFKITPDYDIGINPSIANFYIPIENFKLDIELEFFIKFLNNRGSYAKNEIILSSVRFDSGDVADVIDKDFIGLGNVDNTSDVDKPISNAQQTELDTKAPINNPTFTGTVTGVTKTHVGLSNVDNTSDANKPVSTAQQTALDNKYENSNPNGYETPAQLNTRDTNNRNRTNHTGSQAISTITGLQTELDGKLSNNSTTVSTTSTLFVNFNNHVTDISALSEALTFSNFVVGSLNKEVTIMITDGGISQNLTFQSSWICMNGTFPTSTNKKITIIKAIRHSNGNIYCRSYQT